VGRRRLGEATFAAQHVDHQGAAGFLRRIGHRAAYVGDDDDAPAWLMRTKPGSARLEVTSRNDAAAILPWSERGARTRVKFVAIADEDQGPVRMDPPGEGNDAYRAPIARRPALAKGRSASC